MNENTPTRLAEMVISTENGHHHNDDGSCPHHHNHQISTTGTSGTTTMMQCPSPKKGLAHAIVQCNIHLGRIAEPRILPCGHSFCLRCLDILHHKQQQQQTSSSSSSSVTSTLRLICPLCRKENEFASIESLTINYALSDLLEIFDAEEKEDERVHRETMAEMEHTVYILKRLRHKLRLQLTTTMANGIAMGMDDESAEERAMFKEVIREAISATDKRVSLLESLARETTTDEQKEQPQLDRRAVPDKERLTKKLYFACLSDQRMAEMADGFLTIERPGAPGLAQQLQFFRMYNDTCDVDYRPTESMSERRARVWFSIIFSHFPRLWPTLDQGRYSEGACILAGAFSDSFGGGGEDNDEAVANGAGGGAAWIAVLGRRPLGCWIWKDEHDYACLDVSDWRAIVYRRRLRSRISAHHPPSPDGRRRRRRRGSTTSGGGYEAADDDDCSQLLEQARLDELLDQVVRLKAEKQAQVNGGAGGSDNGDDDSDRRKDLNVAVALRQMLEREFSGQFWHVAAGLRDTYAVYACDERRRSQQQVDLAVWTSEVGDWRAMVWIG